MKVYVLESSPDILGVFSSLEKAMNAYPQFQNNWQDPPEGNDSMVKCIPVKSEDGGEMWYNLNIQEFELDVSVV